MLGGLGWLTYANATNSPAIVEAIEAEARGDYPAALRSATEHLDRRPWSDEATRIIARCLSRLDFAEQAEPYYRRARGLSVADLRYRAYGLTRLNLRDRALRAFDDVLTREPDDVASLRLKAGLLMSISRWKDVAPAEPVLVEAGRPVEVSRWGEVAEIGRRLAKFPRSAEEVETPIALGGHWTFRPLTVESVPSVGATLEAIAAHNSGDPGAAVAACGRVLDLDPGLRSMPIERRAFWAQFGEDLLAIGQAAEAIRWLAIEDSGRSDPALIALQARAHQQLGSIDEAESCWRRFLELAPDDRAGWLNLGRIEAKRENWAESARQFSRAARLDPDSFDAAYNLGLAYRKLGRVDEARKWEQEAARLRPRREARTRGDR